MNHQVGVSGVHQTDTDSDFMPVLGLWLLSKSSRVQQGKPVEFCGVARFQGVVRVRLAVYIRLKQTNIWLCERRTLYQLGV